MDLYIFFFLRIVFNKKYFCQYDFEILTSKLKKWLLLFNLNMNYFTRVRKFGKTTFFILPFKLQFVNVSERQDRK